MAEQLALRITLGQATIPATAQPRLVYALFEVVPAGARPPDRRRLPVNLGLVVDVSQSMQVPIITPEQFEWLARQGRVREMMVDGLPVWHVETPPRGFGRDLPTSVSHVQRALAEVAERLRAGDRSCLVAFASQAQTLVAGTTGPDRLPRAVIEGLAQLNLGDQTYMARGLELGLQEVQRGQAPGWISRILVLTDGFTLDASLCQALAQQARRAGVAMSTIGLGVEFNEELLIGLAESSGGHAYFVHHPQQIPDAFAQELRHLEAVAFRNLEIKLALTPGTELRRAYRVRPALAHLGEVPSEGGSVNLFLGDLEWAAPSAVLLELIVPPRTPGAYRLCQAVLAYDDPDLSAEKVRQDVVLTYSADPAAASAPADATVTGLVERATALALQTQALQQAAQGDLAGATVKLRAAATRLLSLGEAELAQSALREADSLERGQQVSAQGRKEMRYTTRRLTQPLQ